MISGIVNMDLYKSVNSLPFVDNSGFIYNPRFFDWMCETAPNDEVTLLKRTCSTNQVREMSDEELINIMSMLWDKWVEFSNDNSPKPEWLITVEDTDYIELDDIVL